MTMVDQLDFQGYWWLSGKEGKFSGSMKYESNQGAELIVLGELIEGEYNGLTPAVTICGMTSNGKSITLLNCFYRGRTVNLPGIETQKYFSDLLIIGVHISSYSEFSLRRIYFRFTDLEAWINRTGIEINYLEHFNIRVSYNTPNKIQLLLENETTFSIFTKATFPGWSVFQKSATISEKDWLIIDTPSEWSFKLLRNTVYELRNLFSLMVGRSVYLTEMIGESESSMWSDGIRQYYNEIEIYMPYKKNMSYKKPITQPKDVLIPLSAIENQLQEILCAWFNRSRVITPTIDLYFGTLYDSVLHLERHFLFLSQAIETYHRRTSIETDRPLQEHEERLNNILNSVPVSYKKWLNDKLTYSNELSLRKRIKQLVEKFSDVFDGYIDNKGFVDKVVSTRNYLTHYDENSTKNRAKSSQDYLELVFKLRSLIEACLLSEITLSNKDINNLLRYKVAERKQMFVQNS